MAGSGPVPGRVHADRGPRDIDARRRRGRAWRPDGGVLRRAARAGIDRARIRQVEPRPSQGGGWSGGHAQGLARAASQAASTEPQLRAAQPQSGLVRVAVRGEHRAARLGAGHRPHAGRGRQRLWFRRHQLSHRHGGVHARPSANQRPSRPGCGGEGPPTVGAAQAGAADREAAAARGAGARRRDRGGARQRSAHGAGRGAPGPASGPVGSQ